MNKIERLRNEILSLSKSPDPKELQRNILLSTFIRPFLAILDWIYITFSGYYWNIDPHGEKKLKPGELFKFESPRFQYLRIHICRIIIIYLFLKTGNVSAAQLLIFRYLNPQWKALVVKGANRTELCAFSKDIYHEEPVYISEWVHYLLKLLRSLGVYRFIELKNKATKLRNDRDVFQVWQETVPIILTQILFQKLELPFMSSNLIQSPLAVLTLEKRRICQFLRELINGTSSPTVRSNKWRPMRTRRSVQSSKEAKLSHPEGWPNNCICRKIERNERLKFYWLIKKYSIKDKVYSPMLRIAVFWLVVIKIASSWSLYVFSDLRYLTTFREESMHVNELDLRLERDENMAKCHQWNSNATLIHDPTLLRIHEKLQFIELKFDERGNEISLTNKSSKFLYRIEFKHVIELPRFDSFTSRLWYFEKKVHYLMLSFYQAFLFAYFTEMVTFRYLWYRKVKKQLILCNKMLRETIYLSKTERESHRKQIEECLLVILINFKLFIKSHQIGWYLLYAFHVCYLVGIMIFRKNFTLVPWTPFVFMAATMIMNFLLSLIFFHVRCYRRLFNLINNIHPNLIRLEDDDYASEGDDATKLILLKLRPKSNYESGANSFLRIYWRKMMIDDKEVENLYSNRIFGIRVSESNVVNFNEYIFAEHLFSDCMKLEKDTPN